MIHSNLSCAKGRRNQIIEQLNETGDVRISELSERFNVSVVTIRKDLDILEQQGMLQRVHGGAIGTAVNDYNLLDRRAIKRAEKIRIAQMAASLVEEGDSVMINAGSTCYYVANELKLKKNIFVITNALSVVDCLSNSENITTFLLGGRLDAGLRTTSGDSVIEQLQRYSVEKLILGIDGVDPIAGATSYNHREDYIMHHMISQSKNRIIVADDSKIGKASFVKIADMNEIHTLVTNRTNDNLGILQQIEKMGVRVLLA